MVSYFIRPFVIYIATASDDRIMKHVVKNIFRYLIFQSNVGMDYTEKFNAWRQVRLIMQYNIFVFVMGICN